jgi:hypothetical protein
MVVNYKTIIKYQQWSAVGAALTMVSPASVTTKVAGTRVLGWRPLKSAAMV